MLLYVIIEEKTALKVILDTVPFRIRMRKRFRIRIHNTAFQKNSK